MGGKKTKRKAAKKNKERKHSHFDNSNSTHSHGGLHGSSRSSSSSIYSLEENFDVAKEKHTVVDTVKETDPLLINQVIGTQACISVGGTASTSDLNKVATSEGIVQVAKSASDIDMVTLHSIQSLENENIERELGVTNEKTRVSVILVDMGLEKKDGEATVALHNDAVVTSSDVKPLATMYEENNLELFYDAPTVDATVRADGMKGSPHDHQLQVALLQPVQPTSWKSCCGLFELFARSNK